LPQVIITETAAQGLERSRLFLADKNVLASQRAAQIISKYLLLLESNTAIGRPLDDMPELRELVINFGDSGYLALYRFDDEYVYILAFRHQKEVGY
jgi:plasmid stabilization system protein ParE